MSNPNFLDTKPIQLKVVLLGEAAVGKSSIVQRFVKQEFTEGKEPTIGAAFLTSRLRVGERYMKFEIWDTAGQDRFHALAPMYYRNSQAAIVVFDITKKASLQKARLWTEELNRQANPDIIIILVGNKMDMNDFREISIQEAEETAEDMKVTYIETSAKDGTNIEEIFQKIATSISEEYIRLQQRTQSAMSLSMLDPTEDVINTRSTCWC